MFAAGGLTIFDDDIAVGARLAFNDAQSSQALLGLIWDRDSGGKFLNVEASRRIGQNFTLDLQLRFLLDQDVDDLAYNLRRDDYIELFLSYNF